ncbi:MAG: orotate phosphoribosyltransferase [Planctomycetota bacterium]
MSDAEKQLLALLKERSFKRGTFRLASGRTSSYYIDGKMTQVHSRGAHLIGEVLYERTKDLRINGIGGLEVGAVPMATAAVISYHLHGQELEGFWVRDRSKGHGTEKTVEGGIKPGDRVVIVDDVVTTGGSSIRAIQEVRKFGCEVVAVVVLVDRLAGAAEAFGKEGITDYRPVFTLEDLGVTPEVRNPAATT